MKTRYWHELDLIRFLAAMLVAGTHIGFAAWSVHGSFANRLSGMSAGNHMAVSPWLGFGWVGVQVFFVISGMVIAQSAFGKTAGDFMKSRFLRLFPAVWICAPLTYLAIIGVGADSAAGALPELLRSITLLPIGSKIDPVYWTLGVEVVFYAVVFVWLLAGQRPGPEYLALGLAAWSAFYYLATAISEEARVIGYDRVLLLRHGCYFAVGLCLWLWSNRVRSAPVLIAATLSVATSLYDLWGLGVDTVERLGAAGYDLRGFECLPAVIWGGLVGLMALSTHATAVWPRNARLLARRLGLMTFPFYLIHQTVAGLVLRVTVGKQPQWAVFVEAIGAALAVSLALSLWIEPSLRALASSRLSNLQVFLAGSRLKALARP